MEKNKLTKTEELQQLKEKRVKLYQDYMEACSEGNPDEAWSKVEECDIGIIALIMSTNWIESV